MRASRTAADDEATWWRLPTTPGELLDVLRVRWRWVVVPILLSPFASLVVLRFVPKQYRSQTVVMVETDQIPRSFLPRLTTEQARDRLRTVEQEVLARPRLERLIDEMSPYPGLTEAVGRAAVVELVRNRAQVTLRGRDAFVIEYVDTDPHRAQQMATRLATIFIEETTGERARRVQGANEFIERQLEETREQMATLEERLSTMKRRYMGMLPNQLNANLATLQRLQMEQQSITESIRAARDRKAVLDRQVAVQLDMTDPEAQLVSLPTSPAGADASPEIAALRKQLAELRTRYTDEHPEVARILARLERLEAERASAPTEPSGEEPAPLAAELDPASLELNSQMAAIDQEIEGLEKRREEVAAQIERYQRRVEMIPHVEQELQSLERDYAMVSRYYGELMSRKLQAETAGAVERRWNEEQFRILEPAQLPEAPFFPQRWIFMTVGSLLGVGLGLVLALVVETLDTTVKSPADLRGLSPYPVVLTLPRLPAARGHAPNRWRRLWPGARRASEGEEVHGRTA